MPVTLSIITVCLNAAASIGRTFESARAQTHKADEYLLVDGGSSDGTLEIAQSYSDVLTETLSEKDRGIYDAMNKGVRLTRGDVVYFLNADDQLASPEVVKDVLHEFERSPELDMVYGNVIYRFADHEEPARFNRVSPRTLIYSDLCHQAVFARRRLFDKVGMFEERFRINADYDWLLRVFRSDAVIKYVDRNVACFDMGGFHGANRAKLEAERSQVRRQYITRLREANGYFWFRVRRRLLRTVGRW